MNFVFLLIGVAGIWLAWLLIQHFRKLKAERIARLAALKNSGWSLDYVVENYPGVVFDMKNSRFTIIHDKRERVYSFADLKSVDWECIEKIKGPIIQREKNKVVLMLRDPDLPIVKLHFAYDWRGAEQWKAKIPAILGW